MISWLRSGKIWLASTVEATKIVGANMVELQRSSRVEESSQGDFERFVDSVNRFVLHRDTFKFGSVVAMYAGYPRRGFVRDSRVVS